MTAIIVISIWLLCGWIGYRLAIVWWTKSWDLTREERTFFRWLILGGPCTLGAALACLYRVQDRPVREGNSEIVRRQNDCF